MPTVKKFMMVVVTDDYVMEVPVSNFNVQSSCDRLDVSSFNSPYLDLMPGFRRSKVEVEVCGEMTMHRMGSDGWSSLLQLAAGKIAQQQVSSAIHAYLSSEFGARTKVVEERVASALSSLAEVEDKFTAALKKRASRAKKHISSSAHGLYKSLQKKRSKPASPPAPKRKKKAPTTKRRK